MQIRAQGCQEEKEKKTNNCKFKWFFREKREVKN